MELVLLLLVLLLWLELRPKAKKGVCNYYSQDALSKLKTAVAK